MQQNEERFHRKISEIWPSALSLSIHEIKSMISPYKSYGNPDYNGPPTQSCFLSIFARTKYSTQISEIYREKYFGQQTLDLELAVGARSEAVEYTLYLSGEHTQTVFLHSWTSTENAEDLLQLFILANEQHQKDKTVASSQIKGSTILLAIEKITPLDQKSRDAIGWLRSQIPMPGKNATHQDISDKHWQEKTLKGWIEDIILHRGNPELIRKALSAGSDGYIMSDETMQSAFSLKCIQYLESIQLI